ncbi:MAG: GspE/PulE family protein [bacterium]|nr:GspE/PulE family protein [bacterium]
MADEQSASYIVELLLQHAKVENASDIHIDPGTSVTTIRFRIDGILYEKYTFNKNIHHEIISRIKILAHLRIDEHQAPQDGRFRITFNTSEHTDVRVSLLPSFHGETAVLRMLGNSARALSLHDLGLSDSDQQKITKVLQKSQGMILATGPTGSGKTTTLYTLLQKLNISDTSIITIEDPVEFEIAGVRHIQTNPRTGLTFAQGLRSIVRQDPDIIMVGEIRDTETASIAVHTALTGHLLLSTLHTINAATTLPRFIDMHIDPYLIASTIEIIIAQRLIRKLCQQCLGKKCEACNKTGFKGRIGIYEVLVVSDAIRALIMEKAPAHAIAAQAVSEGMVSLIEDGLQKAAQKITTPEEVINSLSY